MIEEDLNATTVEGLLSNATKEPEFIIKKSLQFKSGMNVLGMVASLLDQAAIVSTTAQMKGIVHITLLKLSLLICLRINQCIRSYHTSSEPWVQLILSH